MDNLDKYSVLCDISARIPHRTMCTITLYDGTQLTKELSVGIYEQFQQGSVITEIKPHLVAYKNMPKELSDEIFQLIIDKEKHLSNRIARITDILLRNHIDFRGMLYKKLAIEVPYTVPTKQQ